MNNLPPNPMEELEGERQQTLTDGQDCRPKSTTQSYTPPQNEFIAWCATKGFLDSSTVTELKLNAFLRREVIGRLSKRVKKGDTEPKVVGISVVNQYLSGITSLWKDQASRNQNSNPNPRIGALIKTTLDSCGRREYKRKREGFVDRGKGGMDDGVYSLKQVRALSDSFMTKYVIINLFNFRNTHPACRDRMAFLFTTSMLLRSETLEVAELADLAMFELENEGN